MGRIGLAIFCCGVRLREVRLRPTARTRIMYTPADEVTSLLLGCNAERRAVEPRLGNSPQPSALSFPLRTLQLASGGARYRLYRRLESEPCKR
jgi:hypothetical protein